MAQKCDTGKSVSKTGFQTLEATKQPCNLPSARERGSVTSSTRLPRWPTKFSDMPDLCTLINQAENVCLPACLPGQKCGWYSGKLGQLNSTQDSAKASKADVARLKPLLSATSMYYVVRMYRVHTCVWHHFLASLPAFTRGLPVSGLHRALTLTLWFLLDEKNGLRINRYIRMRVRDSHLPPAGRSQPAGHRISVVIMAFDRL